jgi:extracellular solute-binding protein (family 3)
MRTIPWLTAAVVGLLIAGCAGIASAPTQEDRQVLAPTGNLRVALYLGAPASIIRGATPDESKGVGFDLGKELARRIGVPFEPVVYPSPGAIIGGLKSGEWDLTFFGPSPERESVLNFTAPFLVRARLPRSRRLSDLDHRRSGSTGNSHRCAAGRVRERISGAHNKEGHSDRESERSRRGGNAEVRKGGCLRRQQGKPVRVVGQIARVPSS